MADALDYTVLSGDTIVGIAAGLARCQGVTLAEIEAANPDAPAASLRVGQVVSIPAAGQKTPGLRYTIRAGDSYWSISQGIAAAAGVSADAIAAANADTAATGLTVGQILHIPAATASSSSTPSPSPSPTPGPAPSAPHPTADPVPAPNIGYWARTWISHSSVPGATMGLAFSGWIDTDKALADSRRVLDSLPRERYITFGGGDPKTGAFTAASLTRINDLIESGQLSAYTGIAYDVEEGDSGLNGAFKASFAAAKAAGFRVLVTISHSAPYGIHDASTLMDGFFADPNIDFLSPQLYTTGGETANDWATSHGVTWDRYAAAKAGVVPSIVHAALYPEAEATLKGHGVATAGYVVWAS